MLDYVDTAFTKPHVMIDGFVLLFSPFLFAIKTACH